MSKMARIPVPSALEQWATSPPVAKESNQPEPTDGTITRQRSRASAFAAAYEDVKVTFKNAPRRVRREMARKAAKLVVVRQHND